MVEIAVLSLGTLVLLALAFIGVAVVAYLTRVYAGRVFQWLVLAIASVSVLRTLLTGRVLRLGDSGLELLQEGDMGGTLLGRFMLLVLVGTAFSVCVAWWLQRFGSRQPLYRYSPAGLAELDRLTWAFLFFYLAFSLLPLPFAPRFEFHISLVYALFVWLALLLALRVSAIDPVLVMRQALGLIVLCSLAAAIAMPALALQPGYQSLIPGFSMRLWGVTASANTLGSVAGALLVLQFVERPRGALWYHLLTACAVLALVLTQSKSALGGALLGLLVLFAWRIWRGNSVDTVDPKRVLIGTAIVAFAGAAVLLAIWLIVSDPVTLAALERRLDPRALGGLTTLTGRVYIWEYAIRRGLETPWFGQGLAMWDLQTRLATGLSGAVHAHNQLLQAFSRAGLFGLASLLVLLTFIIRYAFAAANATAGGSLALLAMFLVRSVTEVPLQPNGILGGEFFTFMVLLVYSADRALSARYVVLRAEPNAPQSGLTMGPGVQHERNLAR